MINELKPSREMWEYYARTSVSGAKNNDITLDLILSSLADRLAGYDISYSATELIKDLGLVDSKGNVNKKGKLILAHHLHEKYHHNNLQVVVVVKPN